MKCVRVKSQHIFPYGSGGDVERPMLLSCLPKRKVQSANSVSAKFWTATDSTHNRASFGHYVRFGSMSTRAIGVA